MNIEQPELQVPVWEKYSLNIEEAAAYFGIGEKRIRRIVAEHEGADFLLEIGSHKRIKRVQFEDFLDLSTSI